MTDPMPGTLGTSSSRVLGGRVLHFRELDSTSDEARRRSGDPASHGLAIVADRQTAGRGQYGRVWESPQSLGLLLSVLVFPPETLRRPATLTALAAVAVRQTIFDLTGLPATIKWPNDILIDGRKVCGILCETAGAAAIVGIGLNVLHSRDEFDRRGLPHATSLAIETANPPTIAEVADRLLTHLDEDFAALAAGDIVPLEHRWRAGLNPSGGPIEIDLHTGETVAGRLTHLSLNSLDLELPGGGRVSFSPERIRHVRT